jgi:hypothetical protein
MSNSGNSCNIISIQPFNAFCNPTNASGPNIADGSATITVFGGTPPYTFTWAHGAVGQTITNLLPGTYTCTVKDYYADNVITVECVIEAPAIVHEFELCISDDTNNQIIVLKDLNSSDKVRFEVSGSYVYNIPEIGEVVRIDDLGNIASSSGLRKCCYERLTYNESSPGLFLGYFGTNESSKIVFSSPSACSSSSRNTEKSQLPEKINIFTQDDNKKNRENTITKSSESFKVLNFNKNTFRQVRDLKPSKFKSEIPYVNRNGGIEFTMEKFQPHPSNITVGISDGASRVEQIIKPRITCYRMRTEKGEWGTMLFTEDRVTVNLFVDNKQLAFKKLNDDEYAIFDVNDQATELEPFDCGGAIEDPGSPEETDRIIQKAAKSTNTCTSIALDVSPTILNSFNGSVQQATDFVLGRMAIVSDVYWNQTGGLRLLQISYVNIWNTNPPYDPSPTTYSSSYAAERLYGFRSYWQSNMTDVSRNLAHYLLTSGPAGGNLGIAFKPGCNSSCSSTSGYGASRLRGVPGDSWFPTYETRSLKTIAHELGHNFCCPHAFDCSGGFGTDPITGRPFILEDACTSTDPYCVLYPYNGPKTIMGYCSVDVLVFHPIMLSSKIVPNYGLSPNCLSECLDGPPPPPTPLPTPSPGGPSDPCIYNPNYVGFQTTIKGIVSDLTNLIVGKVYEFAEIGGKYEYKGTTSPTGNIYSLTVIADYDSCLEVLPPTPTPPVQHILCLNDGVSNEYEFLPGIVGSNGYQQWDNSEYNLTVKINDNSNTWEILGWNNVGNGQMVKYTNQQVPTGVWNNVGTSSNLVWQMTIGACQGIPLTVSASPTPVTCVGQSNGSVQLTGMGGEPPYTYTVEGVSPPWPNYWSSGLFSNLPAGTYTAHIKDSQNNTATTTFVIQNGSSTSVYSMVISQNILTDGADNNSIFKTGEFSIFSNPSLSQNAIVSFKINAYVTYSYNNNGSVSFVSEFNPVKNNFTPITVSQTNETTTTTSVCDNKYTKYTKSFSYVSQVVNMSVTDIVNGNFSYQFIFNNISTDCSCPTEVSANFTIALTDITISGNSCDQISQYVEQPTSNISGERCITLPSPTPSITKTMTLTPTKTITPTPEATLGRTPTPTPTLTQTPNPVANCSNIYYFSDSGIAKKFKFTIEVGTGTGQFGILYDVINNAKRFKIEWNGTQVADSLWVGAGNEPGLGGYSFDIYEEYSINNNNVTYTNNTFGTEPTVVSSSEFDLGSNTGTLTFFKNQAYPSEIVVYIYSNSKYSDIQYIIDPICNDLTPTPSVTARVTVTPTLTQTPTPSTSEPLPLIPCDQANTIQFEWDDAGVFEANIDLGTDIGTVDVTLNALSIPDRFEIFWNDVKVADSLFVGYLSANSYYQDNILNATVLNKFLYDAQTGEFVPNGQTNVSYNIGDIAPNIPDGRLAGSQGNQIGVVAGYPLVGYIATQGVNANEGEVKLRFFKDQEYPTSIKLVISSVEPNTIFRLLGVTCPYEYVEEYTYFTLETICDSIDNPFNSDVTFRILNYDGFNTGVSSYITLTSPIGGSESKNCGYKVILVDEVANAYDISTSEFAGPYTDPLEAVQSSYNTYQRGCRRRYRDCCTQGSVTSTILGVNVDFNVNRPQIVFDEVRYSENFLSSNGVTNVGGTNTCVSSLPYSSDVSYNPSLEGIFFGTGSNSDTSCTSGRCARCYTTVKPCGSSDIRLWVYEPDPSVDYSIGSFISQSDNTGLEEYNTTCLEIVDPNTTLTQYGALQGYYSTHVNISDCNSCLN